MIEPIRTPEMRFARPDNQRKTEPRKRHPVFRFAVAAMLLCILPALSATYLHGQISSTMPVQNGGPVLL